MEFVYWRLRVGNCYLPRWGFEHFCGSSIRRRISIRISLVMLLKEQNYEL